MNDLHWREAGAADWFDTRATVVGDKVLVRPRGSNALHCLDLATGNFVWKQPCDDYWYLAGISVENVALVGRTAACAFDLATGRPVWNQPFNALHSAGRALVTGGNLYIPKSSRELTAINMSTGQLLSGLRPPGQKGLGNLVQSGDLFVWQNARAVGAFPFVAPQAQDVAASDLPVITPGGAGVR
jgi:outer membrane protein assembly factor BamB